LILMSVTKSSNAILETKGVSKHFGGITALDNVNFDLRQREVVGLVGDNGAGKSTLIKILSGVHSPSSGTVLKNGRVIDLPNPRSAWNHGIATVFQELALVDKMNAVENIFLGHEEGDEYWGLRVLDNQKMIRRTKKLLGRLEVTLQSLFEPVGRLSGGERQAVAISRALNLEAEVIILDEPTSALAVEEANKVLNFVSSLREQGKSVILISHNLKHVYRVADRLTVLRNGNVVAQQSVEEVDQDTAVGLITGTIQSFEQATPA